MAFLDRQSRVVDFILTEHGRKLYALGQLDFEFFSLLDDGIDYDPWATGSLSDAAREAQVEATPSWEAPFVRDVRGATAPLEPTSHLFAASQGFTYLPFMSAPLDGSSSSLMCDQRRDGDAYRRTGTSVAQIDLGLRGQPENGNPGFIIRVFKSGSSGLSLIEPRTDLSGRRAIDPFIAVVVDDERPLDVPSVGKPDSPRSRPLGLSSARPLSSMVKLGVPRKR